LVPLETIAEVAGLPIGDLDNPKSDFHHDVANTGHLPNSSEHNLIVMFYLAYHFRGKDTLISPRGSILDQTIRYSVETKHRDFVTLVTTTFTASPNEPILPYSPVK
jgi:hypothetical protein